MSSAFWTLKQQVVIVGAVSTLKSVGLITFGVSLISWELKKKDPVSRMSDSPTGAFMFTAGISSLVTCYFLFQGFKNDYSKSLVPWIIVEILLFFLGLITFVAMYYYFKQFKDDSEISALLTGIIMTIFEIYMITIVVSYYRHLSFYSKQRRINTLSNMGIMVTDLSTEDLNGILCEEYPFLSTKSETIQRKSSSVFLGRKCKSKGKIKKLSTNKRR